MVKRLYIIGNGFDLFHEIESSYKHFREFVDENDPHFSYTANEYIFENEDDWCDFENNLGKINPNRIYNQLEPEHLNFEDEDFSERNIHRFNDTISNDLDTLDFQPIFTKWISSVYIPTRDECDELLLDIDSNSLFLTFNYTNTLQKVYLIPEGQVNHIHNTINNPIFGHGAEEVTSYDGPEWSPADEMSGDIKQYFIKSKKDVLDILAQNDSFFASLQDIDEVHVIGHSLNEIDLPYFKEVKKRINKSAKWFVTYYNKDKCEYLKDQLLIIGLNLSDFSLIHIDKYNTSVQSLIHPGLF